MAFKFENSLEGYQSNLALFHPKPVDTGIEQIQYIDYRPISQLSSGSFVEFNISPTSMEYIDLRKTRLHLKVRILRNDGTQVTPEDKVGFVNLPMQSMWKQCDLSLQQVNISPTTSCFYAIKSYIDCILSNSEDASESQLQNQGFYKDTAGYMDATDPTIGGNLGLGQRYLWTKDGNAFDMEGPLYTDCCQMNRLILNGVQVNIKLYPSSNEFVLMSENNHYKVDIVDVGLKVCHMKVNSAIILSHNNALTDGNAIYPIMKSNIKTFSVAAGLQSFSQDDLFQGEVPTRLIVGLTSSAAFNGTINKNPFNFKNMNLSFLSFYVDGESRPAMPLTPNYKTNNYISEYLTLFTGTGKYRTNNGLYISKEDFKAGYSLYVLDLDENHSQDYVSLNRRGHTRLSIRFQDPLAEPIVVVAYAQTHSNFQIDKARNVILN